MKRKTSSDSPERVYSTIGFSIASRLNLRLWLSLFVIFFMLDICLIVTAGVGGVMYAERTLAPVADIIVDLNLLDFGTAELLELSRVDIDVVRREPSGFLPPRPFRDFLPDQTASGTRKLTFQAGPEVPILKRVNSLAYIIELENGGRTYSLSLGLSPIISILKMLFAVVLAIELYVLLRSMFSNFRLIRSTLRPISDLAEKAQSLNTDQGPYTVEEMEVLAGKLEGINAARLDTRIELDETQDELKNLASAINKMLERINESYRAQARFVSDASHELRTPIAAIQGYANLLDRWGKYDEAALQESIDAIKDETANMKELVEQLLFLARGDNNTMPLQNERFDLADMAATVLRETQMMDGGHDFELKVDNVFVYADPGLIKQALRILVDNAIKYTPIGESITIMVEERDNQGWLTVQDNGIGIPPEAISHIFDRFYRADESRARATGGTGLGLSIAKWIAERHGGHVEVVSREDLGTRISIVIPALAEVQ